MNRSLVANFIPEPPRLAASLPRPGTLALSWPTNKSAGFVLQRTTNLNPINWVKVAEAPTVVGTNKQVTITPLAGPGGFFRLAQP